MRLTYIFTLLILPIFFSCQSQQEATTNQNALVTSKDIAINWALTKNDFDEEKNNRHFATFIIKNTGNKPLKNNWTLYFNQIMGPVTGNATADNAFLEQINGDFFKLKPAKNFYLNPNESDTIAYKGKYWAIKESDAPAGLYIVFEDGNGKELFPQAIENYTVAPFTRKEQLSLTPNDKYPIPTNEYRYNENAKLTNLSAKEVLPVIPTPLKSTKGKEVLALNAAFAIHYYGDIKAEAEYLSATLEELGLDIKTYDSGSDGNQSIRLSIISQPIAGKSQEAYRLTIAPEKEQILIEGTDAAGIFYGIQSLKALIPYDYLKQQNTTIRIPTWTIEDAPRFEYRGLMLDVSRNFHSKKVVKKLLDIMATYKLNKFHFHLTDDEGWRVEIPGLPELTEVGAKRGPAAEGIDQLQPAYGSGLDDNRGDGHFSVQDYIEIVQHAHKLHIEVIPEIDLPGHARAAIVAMKVRQKRLKAAGKAAEANKYILHDDADASSYSSAQNYKDNVINVCMESTYTFIGKVVDELIAMHEKAGVPLKTLHTGGDEVPSGVWQKSPECAAFIAEISDVKGDKVALTNYFMTRFSDILLERNLVVAGWEEIALSLAGHGHSRRPNPQFVNSNFLPYVWNSIFGWGGEDIAYQLANLGYKVVLCNASNLYFDLAYDKDPKNAGLYWAGYVNTRTAYDFVPFDLFQTARMGRFGEELNIDDLKKDKVALNPAAQKNVAGIQGQLWSEALISPERLELATFPKLMGLAERAWAAQPSWADTPDEKKRFADLEKDWNRFANTIGQREMNRWDNMEGGIGYYIPPAGAKIENGKLYANSAYPGLSIRYTLDGSEPTMQSLEWTQPVAVDGAVKVKIFSAGGHSSRSILVEKKLVN